MNNYIIYDNNEVCSVDDLSYYFPFSMLESDELTLRVSQIIAEHVYGFTIETNEYKVGINFLVQRSLKVKIIVALILLSKEKRIKIIHVEYISPIFKHLFYKDVEIIDFKLRPHYLDTQSIFNTFSKYFINNIFYTIYTIFYKKVKKKSVVVRSWIDIDEVLHQEIFSDATIYIYPYGINLLRGLKFIIHCFKKYKSVTLMGVPYRFQDIINIYVQKLNGSDKGAINYEINGMLLHSKDFKYYSSIYTSDEFIPAVLSLYDSILLDNNVKIINNCHGIGMYNRYLNYNEVIVFNEIQKNYYEKCNSSVNFKIKNLKLNFTSRFVDSTQNIVFFEQALLDNYGLNYEANLQNQLFILLNTLASHDELNCLIKFHPNRTQKSKLRILNTYKSLREVQSIETLVNNSNIFLNFGSTSYFDYNEYGQFIFIKDKFFDPTKIFGKNIKTIEINELYEYLCKVFKIN